jgi:hypothetical protein
MRQIKVIIDRYGNTKIDAEGFTGESCVAATQAIEQVLGGGGKSTKKPEYDQPAGTDQEEQTLRF